MKAVGTDLGGPGGPTATDGIAKAGRHTFLQSAPIPTAGMQNVRLDFWQQYAINGTLTISVNGTQVYSYTSDGSTWSNGWRFQSIALGDTATDNKTGLTVRFEVNANATNALGGWTIDNVGITGTAIPPPPPPPMPPPPTTNPPPDNNPPGTNPGTNPPSNTIPGETGDPGSPSQPNGQGSGSVDQGSDPNAPSSFSGHVDGGCVCVAPSSTGSPAAAVLAILGLAFGLGRRRR
jgi:MYXO-CTERM domain-containing protein